ncbi:hypothetical protein D3C86_1933850 [compost metagenome]
MPENNDIATSVASGARVRTRACCTRPKHMMAMPQNTLNAPIHNGCPANGNSSIRHTARVPMAAINNPRG